ncbi:MAG: aminopeptidase family protein [Acidimicrobiaceae bacterium]|nr:aminopeptidase family protein [Acidimicrobiaceae bacterium]
MTVSSSATESKWSAVEPVPSLFQTNFSANELALRRRAVASEIGEDAVALAQGAPAVRGFSLFRQSNDFFYLSGVEVPHAYLLVDGRDGRSTLYLQHRDAALESSEGQRLHADASAEVAALTGVESVQPLECLASDLQRLVLKRGSLACYTPFAPAELERCSRDQLLRAAGSATADGLAAPANVEGHLVGLLGRQIPQLEVRDLSPMLDRLRLVKSPREIELLRLAGSLSAKAVTEAMRSTAPGVAEYELGALAGACFALGGARGEAYRAIIGSGHNAWFGHYGRQGSLLADGELVLMDCAPDVAYYTSDIGRMWPVNGTYSPLQRLLYGFMVDYHKVLLGAIRAGRLAGEIMDEAAAVMRAQIERTDFPDMIYRQAALATLEFRGHLSHPVGMAVHDVGDYTAEPLRPGTVFAVDPQMWVPAVDLYVRVEDTVVVTEDGIENLTTLAPLELDDVEAVMREDGLLAHIARVRPDWPGGTGLRP